MELQALFLLFFGVQALLETRAGEYGVDTETAQVGDG